ncbi:hypothetical protein [Gulosibacter sp. 10]|uniref:hypothetical protein n=1 Tax=Gulosibacter sp. 10 TaxID=1255570 RepID=UPI00097EAA82|nr:hypothetical protein [Gulosibacter sp. 10]SJM49512.1 hypothetical protein FM112_01110 [Gulosibacter sp. 10]
MARNRGVRRNQLEMWLGFVGFFAAMAVLSVLVALVTGRPVDPAAVLLAAGLLVTLLLLWLRYRRG